MECFSALQSPALTGDSATLAALMGLYESNYRRLLRLIPEKRIAFDAAVSRSELDNDLHLRVLARDRYTLTLRLTYLFKDGLNAGAADQANPDLVVRVYHDAGLAEAMDHRDHEPAPKHAFPERFAASWRRNVLLNKWLDFLLDRGHGFALAGRPRAMALELP